MGSLLEQKMEVGGGYKSRPSVLLDFVPAKKRHISCKVPNDIRALRWEIKKRILKEDRLTITSSPFTSCIVSFNRLF